MNALKKFWSDLYAENRTGWDLGVPSPPLQAYFDQLTDKEMSILIPGSGSAYEAAYPYKLGFSNVHVLDIAPEPLARFSKHHPTFPKSQLIEGDFFEFKGQFDLIIEQTFFCSFPPLPTTRQRYALQMNDLLKLDGKLVGLWFDFPLTGDMEKRPFGGDKQE